MYLSSSPGCINRDRSLHVSVIDSVEMLEEIVGNFGLISSMSTSMIAGVEGKGVRETRREEKRREEKRIE